MKLRTGRIYCSLAGIACICFFFALGWRTGYSTIPDETEHVMRQNGACDGELQLAGAKEFVLSVDGEKWAVTSASPIAWDSVDECRVLKASRGRAWLVLLVKTVNAEESVFWCGFVSDNAAINAAEGETIDHQRGRLSVDFLECGRGTPDAKILAASTDFYDLFLVYGQTVQHRFIGGGVCTIENLPGKPFVRTGKCSVEYGAITHENREGVKRGIRRTE